MQAHRDPGSADKDVQWDSYQAGLLEGRALAVLDLLRIRGIEIDPASEERVLTCRERDQLIVWIARATTLVRVEELFEPCSYTLPPMSCTP